VNYQVEIAVHRVKEKRTSKKHQRANLKWEQRSLLGKKKEEEKKLLESKRKRENIDTGG